MTLLECNALMKTYETIPALTDVSLTIEGGHIIGLLGPNGSGKTTLLKLIAGLLQPTSGTIRIQGEPVGTASKNLISYLPDHCYLNQSMKIREIIAFFQDFYRDFASERAYDMLEKLDIDPGCKLKTLSKGTREKVQLILVMSRRAGLYILDEPIAGVDPAARDYILQTILGNYDEHATIIISTHLISDIENILDQVIFLQNGRIHTHASVDELREQSRKSIDTLFREVFRC
ncbi:ABC transporter ATP-binding protein [Lachnospiraceae bacterium KK002]